MTLSCASADTSEPQTVMKIPAIITASLAIFFFATPAQAGHGAFGSCFCGSQDGLEIDKGAYTTDCDPGSKTYLFLTNILNVFYPQLPAYAFTILKGAISMENV